jgi:hypothetical protein
MSLSFPRSTRTITNDTFRPSVIGLVIALLVFVIWGVWFAVTRVPLYESSSDAELARDGDVIAHFEPNALARIRPGQDAVVIDPVNGEPRRAEVMELGNPNQNRMEPNAARLFVYGSALQQPPKHIQIQVGEESPLISLLRLGTQAVSAQTAR